MAIQRIQVVGLGKVGELVAHLLAEAGYEVCGADVRPRDDLPFATKVVDVGDPATLRASLADVDAVVSCLPYHRNLAVAEAAGTACVHYFDLTEDVATTARVRALAAEVERDEVDVVFAPQCGLAPGLIGIVGASLAEHFRTVRHMELRVGALPQHPAGLLGYAFNWSPEGVVNEYLNDSEVIREGRRQLVPAMTELETVVIGGTRLEAFHTSGGLGTLCETFEGRTQHLDYKTLRYPGHGELMRFFFDELMLRDRRELAGEILVNAKPPVDDDVVYLYAAVEGEGEHGLARRQYVRAWYPREIAGRRWRAISWTTAASACAVIDLVSKGQLRTRGFLRQEEVPFADLLATPTGSLFEDGAPA
ncbi:saccharopine dehydrogenase NADP-binding domain-containing protein [Aquihabitans sp. G128]|uniref:saccharopine dehydrogenase family protein n=1 Tax=Aquihabitans sp. G128 TaxID=2849779 RepID=UPI001C22E57D|nr:saccharopine dehydrogenase C-terminal domain-containing protein [Aquihabitans sp. G128]QXC61009.1 saccharopine dehydrogenase NADP-binding domain-containing protein [Aquihabitans sp. G128]